MVTIKTKTTKIETNTQTQIKLDNPSDRVICIGDIHGNYDMVIKL